MTDTSHVKVLDKVKPKSQDEIQHKQDLAKIKSMAKQPQQGEFTKHSVAEDMEAYQAKQKLDLAKRQAEAAAQAEKVRHEKEVAEQKKKEEEQKAALAKKKADEEAAAEKKKQEEAEA